MNVKKRTVLLRCFINLLAGFLVSFLVMSAFAEVTTVEGTKHRYQVGTKGYESYCLLQRILHVNTTDDLYGTTKMSSIDGTCPPYTIGAKCIIYGQVAGQSIRASESKWLYNSVETQAVVPMTSYTDPPKGTYSCHGLTAVYYNGAFQESSTFPTPFISVE